MHLDLDDSVAPARLAAPALDVERKTAFLVTARLGVLRHGKKIADHVEHTRIRRRIGTRRAPDGRLVDVHDLIHIFKALDEMCIRDRLLRRLRRVSAI